MKYNLFLFDLDDTLLDFSESERLSFFLALKSLGIKCSLEEMYESYKEINRELWKLFELNLTTKEHLKVERFRKVFQSFEIDIDPAIASERYLETLPQTVVLMDHALQTCEWLSKHGEIGIITNGIHAVQEQRIKNSKLAPYISFLAVSELCGHAKPDRRFFEFTVSMAKAFTKSSTIIIGDRLEADIKGAHNFGIDSCLFNPAGIKNETGVFPTYEIDHLSELKNILRKNEKDR